MRQISHLHCHTEYSMLDGCLSPYKLVDAALEKGIKELAVTEHGNMASSIPFYIYAKEKGIKPIFGLEAYVVDSVKRMREDKDGKSSHIVLLAIDNEGFENLLKISKFSWITGFYYRPKIDYKHLEKYSKGIVALSACLGGVINNAIKYQGYEEAKKKAILLKKIFGDRFYLELQVMEYVYNCNLEKVMKEISKDKDESSVKEKLMYLDVHKIDYVNILKDNINTLEIIPNYEKKMKKLLGDNWLDLATANKYLIQLSKVLDIPLVVTGDCHYPKKGQHILQDLVIKVGFGGYKADSNKAASSGRGYYSKELYLKNNDDLVKTSKKYHPYLPISVLRRAIRNTNKIADSVTTDISIGKHQLPKFDVTSHPLYKKGYDSRKLFEVATRIGFKKIVVPRIKKEQIEQYTKQLDFELKIIEDANFADYFLIVEDIVRWARRNNITCVARGSVAGSLVAYALDITGVDPIKYKLLFERFLNPTRVSGERAKSADALPDIDMDFERFGRGRVKQYIVEKYGKDHVCTIGSYGTMGVKLLVKDFMRVLDYKINGKEYDYVTINKIMTDVDIGVNTINDACDSSALFTEFYNDNIEWFEKYIRPLQGEIRSMSKHAAGVLVTPTPYTEWIPIRTATVKEEDGEEYKEVISQIEDTYCERRGLLKLDILGVKQLDVFHRCIELIKERHKLDITFDMIDTEDKEVFKKFHAGNNHGVFQFNSKIQSEYMRKLKPDNIEDLCSCNAILRPGPMHENVHERFIGLKNGKIKIKYDHKCVIPYLKDTYGEMIFQEQLMQISHALGGLSLADADVMRSAIKKKDAEKMSTFEESFVKGAVSNGLTKKHAKDVWNKIVAFSAYSFNRSHSMSYALQGYYCQWFKTYFPNEFYTATLDFSSDDIKKNENIYTHRTNIRKEGIKIVPSDINSSCTRFTLTKVGSIRWPLKAIKSVGPKAAQAVAAIQPISGLEDFYARVNKRVLNKRVMMKLIFSGAFRKFGSTKKIVKSYFDLRKEKVPEEYTNLSKTDITVLKDETLGFISRSYKEMFEESFSKDLVTYKEFRKARKYMRLRVGGFLSEIREITARNGKMAFMKIIDKDEEYEVVAFNSFWTMVRNKPEKGNIIEVQGTKGYSPRGDHQLVLGNKADKIRIL